MEPNPSIEGIFSEVKAHLDLARAFGVDEFRRPPKGSRPRSSEPGAELPAPSLFSSPEGKEEIPVSLEALREEIGECTRCKLSPTRKHIVFGTGNPKAELVFVGEAPGEDEDLQGEPFVGRAGQLLTKIINAMGLSRDAVYIANIIKCRPPKNRNPQPDEIRSCEPFLIKQLLFIRPKVICALGNFAAQTLLATPQKISQLRGRFHLYRGIKVMPTFHPAYLLRNPAEKRQVWEDMQKIMEELQAGRKSR